MKPTSFYFYLPKEYWPSDAPGESEAVRGPFRGNSRSWILQNYLFLKRAGKLSCALVSKLPDSGIIIAHRVDLPFDFKPNERSLLVCAKSDYDWHYWSQLHLVQNRADKYGGKESALWKSYYMSHRSEWGLSPRDPSRGDRFENICFPGITYNLDPALKTQEWSDKLKSLGLNWILMEKSRWHDYSEADAVVAVRSFEAHPYNHKPAAKLFNAWSAGVPAILGSESAYKAERKSELDYIEVRSTQEVLAALKHLREDRPLYRRMVENGSLRAKETASEKITKEWEDFLVHTAAPAHEEWCRLPKIKQDLFFVCRWLALKKAGLFRKIKGSRDPHGPH